MDEHLAHISEDEFYSEEDKKEKSKDAKSKDKETKEAVAKEVKEKDNKVTKPEEEVVAEESDHSADDPSGKKRLTINILSTFFCLNIVLCLVMGSLSLKTRR